MANPAPPPNLDELDPMHLTSHSRSHSHHSIPNPTEATAEPTHESHPLHEPKLGESQQHLHPEGGGVGGGGGVIPVAPQSLAGGGGLEGDYGEPTTGERIQENFFLVVTLGLAAAFWLMALISQAIVTAQRTSVFSLPPSFLPCFLLSSRTIPRTNTYPFSCVQNQTHSSAQPGSP
jgi:hypothetical protein